VISVSARVDLAPTLKAIRQLEPDTIKTLRKDLKSKLSPVTSKIQSAIPSVAPLSGMNNAGRLSWGKPRVSVSLSTGSVKSGQQFHALVAITISGAGFFMAEMAGARGKYGQWRERTNPYKGRGGTIRAHNITTQGRHMVEVLNQRYPYKGKAGRFAWAEYTKTQEDLAGIVLTILNEVTADFNKRIGF
jgi:hypothetical protein